MKLKLDESEKIEKRRKAWEKIRQRGKRSFAFRYGALGWGGFMVVFMTSATAFVEHKRLDWLYLLINVLLWPLAGYIWGLWMWRWLDEQFHGPTNRPPSIIRNQASKLMSSKRGE
jgi:hypothetical protein